MQRLESVHVAARFLGRRLCRDTRHAVARARGAAHVSFPESALVAWRAVPSIWVLDAQLGLAPTPTVSSETALLTSKSLKARQRDSSRAHRIEQALVQRQASARRPLTPQDRFWAALLQAGLQLYWFWFCWQTAPMGLLLEGFASASKNEALGEAVNTGNCFGNT